MSGSYLVAKYAPIVEVQLDKTGKKEEPSNAFISQLIVREFLAIISTWLMQEQPESPVLFYRKFLRLSRSSLHDLLK